MSYATKQEAQKRGEIGLAFIKKDRLHGRGWRIKVWENLGWHVAWTKGSAEVYEGRRIIGYSYSCLISDEPNKPGSGSSEWSTHAGSFSTPLQAYLHEVAAVRKYFSRVNSVLLSLNS